MFVLFAPLLRNTTAFTLAAPTWGGLSPARSFPTRSNTSSTRPARLYPTAVISVSNTTTIAAPTTGLFSTEKNFGMLGVDATIVEALHAEAIEHPTNIQSRGIPTILSKSDVILGAATGSGKTLAYLVPIVQQLKYAELMETESSRHGLRVRRRARAVILVPTRELAEQVMQVARSLSHRVKFRAACATGGASTPVERRIKERLDELGGIDVLVATTGRLMQLVNARLLDIRYTRHVVIDEVDTMFDKGFAPEVKRLLQAAGSALPDGEHVQLIAAGATHPPATAAVYAATFRNPVRIDVDLHVTPVGLEQRFVRVAGSDKTAELASLIRDDTASKRGGIMVFCNTVESARFAAHFLAECDIATGCAHADMPPARRDTEWSRFRDGAVPVLVATDMVGRGLDHTGVRHVILFDFPPSAVDYVHRAGRTARAGHTGRVTSLVTKKDESLARALEKAARARVDALASEEEAKRMALERKRKELAAKREREASPESPQGAVTVGAPSARTAGESKNRRNNIRRGPGASRRCCNHRRGGNSGRRSLARRR